MNIVYQKYRDANEDPLFTLNDSELSEYLNPFEKTEELVNRTHKEHSIASLRSRMDFEHKMKARHNALHNIEKSYLNKYVFLFWIMK